MSKMTDYQKAVAAHMATAPEPLADYVKGRLKKSDKWEEGYNPITKCGFKWVDSKEKVDFWVNISLKNWQRAMDTEFWKKHTAAQGELLLTPDIEFEKPYDFVNPAHYQEFSVEVVDMMVAIWGKEATAQHCEMCAFKYKLRAGSKPDQPIERDLDKAAWYLSKAKELRDA
jgi:hypothetical protein